MSWLKRRRERKRLLDGGSWDTLKINIKLRPGDIPYKSSCNVFGIGTWVELIVDSKVFVSTFVKHERYGGDVRRVEARVKQLKKIAKRLQKAARP